MQLVLHSAAITHVGLPLTIFSICWIWMMTYCYYIFMCIPLVPWGCIQDKVQHVPLLHTKAIPFCGSQMQQRVREGETPSRGNAIACRCYVYLHLLPGHDGYMELVPTVLITPLWHQDKLLYWHSKALAGRVTVSELEKSFPLYYGRGLSSWEQISLR